MTDSAAFGNGDSFQRRPDLTAFRKKHEENRSNRLKDFLLPVRELLALDDLKSRPLIVTGLSGNYAPYRISAGLEENANLVAQDLQNVEEFIDMVQSIREDVSILDISEVSPSEIAGRIREIPSTHVLILPPNCWELRTSDDGEVMIAPEDQAFLKRLGVPESSVAFVGRHLGVYLLSQALFASKQGATVSAVLSDLHELPDAIVPTAGPRAFAKRMRELIARDAGIIDVVRFHDVDPTRQLPLFGLGRELAAGLVRCVRGPQPLQFRIAAIDEEDVVPEKYMELGEAGTFGGPQVGKAVGQTDWHTPSLDAIQKPWDFFTFDEERIEIVLASEGHTELVRLGEMVDQLGHADTIPPFDKGKSGRRVPVLTERNVADIASGRWEGGVGDEAWWIGSEEESNDYFTMPGDFAVPLSGLYDDPAGIVWLPDTAAGAVGDWELDIFRVREEWAYVTPWLNDFLSGEAGRHWFSKSFPSGANVRLDAIMDWQIPVPHRKLAESFADVARLEERLYATFKRIKYERASLFRLKAGKPGWVGLPRFIAKLNALERAAVDVGTLEGFARSAYPTPLARLWAAYLESEDSAAFTAGLQLFENSAAFVGGLAAACLDERGVFIGSDYANRMRLSLAKGMTFGGWIRLLNSLQLSAPASVLADALREVVGAPAFKAALRTAEQIRNKHAHYLLSRANMESGLDLIAETAEPFLRSLEPISGIELVHIVSARNDPRRAECRAYQARVLAGEQGRFRESGSLESRHLHQDALYLRAPGERWTLASPFLQVTEGSVVHIVDRFDQESRSVSYRPLDRSGEFTDPQVFDSLAQLLDTKSR